MSPSKLPIYLEIGTKKTFAGVLGYPGWGRVSKDATSALQNLIDYAPRYAQVMKHAKLDFTPPTALTDFQEAERVQGGSSTDFGVPGEILESDRQPVSEAELARLQTILSACFKALAAAAKAAEGKELKKGPRGGGRELEKILTHVLESNGGYLKMVNQTTPEGSEADLTGWLKASESAVLDAFAQRAALSAREQEEDTGPRGGKRWPARYFARRVAWHILDHVWEIEDRIL